ncbi:MAG: translesion error-prone DNA polymerase V autoproteolytic subunit [Deltaproteobacteria bacterium]|nr:translesion error-prone DNA polymerase V autoproteolytic subunit [Candidatus Anaeroferrophillus wilburensis]MBN2889821.1 translesion error-prone DNA polymerase V autoproteolytic subunit [Deltaproteobacteria bacterium]
MQTRSIPGHNHVAPVRVVELFATDLQAPVCRLPLAVASVSAGFPSPADDYLEGALDLNQYLIKHPAATFFVRVAGDSMIEAGIHDGDLLLVDRSLEAADGRVVIAVINGELLVKRARTMGERLFLLPENPAYEPIEVREEMDFELWGVVTYVIHSL